MKSRSPGSVPDCLIALASCLAICGCAGGGGSSSNQRPGPPGLPAPPANSPEFDAQYGLSVIRAKPQSDADGSGVTIAFLDSGIDTDHSEFLGRIDTASRDMVVNREIEDFSPGHGTLVASIAAAAEDGRGMQGVAPNADILMMVGSAPDCGTPGNRACANFPNDAIVRAVDHAIENDSRVLNMSFGWPTADSPESLETVADAFERAASRDLVIVIAAGNDSASNPIFPGILASRPELSSNVVVAGAIDESNQLAVFSNRAGSTRENFVVAPGVSIYGAATGGGYRTANGTSLSAPHVSGAIAAIVSAFPGVTAREALSVLMDASIDLGSTGTDAIFGRGLIDLEAALTPAGELSAVVSELGSVSLDTLSLQLNPYFGDWIIQSGLLSDIVFRDERDLPYRAELLPEVDSAVALHVASRNRANFAHSWQSDIRVGSTSIRFFLQPRKRSHASLRARQNAKIFGENPAIQATSVSFAIGRSRYRLDLGLPSVGALESMMVSSSDYLQSFKNPPGRVDPVSFTGLSSLGDHSFISYFVGLSRHGRMAGIELGRLARRTGWSLELGRSHSRVSRYFPHFPESSDENRSSAEFAAINLFREFGSDWKIASRFEIGHVTSGASRGSRSRSYAELSSWNVELSKRITRGQMYLSVGQPLRARSADVSLTDLYGPKSPDSVTRDRRIQLSPSGREINVELGYQVLTRKNVSIHASMAMTMSPLHFRNADAIFSTSLLASRRF